MQDNTQSMLSQNEIDRMLSEARSQASGGAVAPLPEAAARYRIVRPYDFKRPSMLSKDQLRTIQMVFENCARIASAGFGRDLHTNAQISLTSLEQSTFQEYLRVLTDKKTTVLNIASVEPQGGTFVFEYGLDLGFVMVNHLLGGGGETTPLQREVTEVEDALLQSMGEVFLSAFGEAWKDLIPLSPSLQRIDYSPRFLQITGMAAPVLIVSFDSRIAETSYEMSLCLPYSLIEGEVSKLNMQNLYMSAGGQDPDHALPAQSLAPIRIPITAELAQVDVPFATLSNLAVGDVLRLNGQISDPLLIRVNGMPAFSGRPGLLPNGWLGVQILTTITMEDDIS